MGEMGSEGEDGWAEVVGFEKGKRKEKKRKKREKRRGERKKEWRRKRIFFGGVRSCGETRACKLGRE